MSFTCTRFSAEDRRALLACASSVAKMLKSQEQILSAISEVQAALAKPKKRTELAVRKAAQ